MTTVRKLIDEKAETKIYTVPSNATVFDALQVMCEGNTGAVLVTEDEKIVGIFTERDYAREGEVKGRSARETTRFRCHDQPNGSDQTRNQSGRMCRFDGQISCASPACAR